MDTIQDHSVYTTHVCTCTYYKDLCLLIQKPLTVEQVLARRVVCDPITVAMAAPTGDGGAAAILCNEEFVKKHNLEVRTYTYVPGLALHI